MAARAREKAHRTLGYALAALIVLGLTLFLLTNDAAIIETFLSWEQIRRSAKDVLRAFWLNLWIALVAECAILVVALSLALIRLSPGRAMAPLRMLAIAYIDIFRAIPLVILLYLVAFGIPIAEVPVLSDLPTPWLIVIGLTTTTSAYVAEVFRAGIESVHWSQTAAAKSLGFTTTQTWSYVVVPQALRKLFPPLLSYFIGLQKDTALVLVVGAVDAFGQAEDLRRQLLQPLVGHVRRDGLHRGHDPADEVRRLSSSRARRARRGCGRCDAAARGRLGAQALRRGRGPQGHQHLGRVARGRVPDRGLGLRASPRSCAASTGSRRSRRARSASRATSSPGRA